ncbi:hypothetical protein AB0I72_19385 [Nocardiopsis sp. NPDC049922]|uniref:hypothetical protein n=1 Tax=Nocardiopsis sp. NPDC049922 TaxID=3155157 RepID=UPI0033D7C94A
MPEDFTPTEEMKAWARENAPTCGMRDHEAFMDFWLSVPGAKARKVDWVRTWKNWMRREHDKRAAPPTPRRAPQQRTTTTDKVNGWLALADNPTATDVLELEGTEWHTTGTSTNGLGA